MLFYTIQAEGHINMYRISFSLFLITNTVHFVILYPWPIAHDPWYYVHSHRILPFHRLTPDIYIYSLFDNNNKGCHYSPTLSQTNLNSMAELKIWNKNRSLNIHFMVRAMNTGEKGNSRARHKWRIYVHGMQTVWAIWNYIEHGCVCVWFMGDDYEQNNIIKTHFIHE